ncbi:MAG TPA: sulfite exporter TauE/SafE family protein [Thermoleophilaceae bacterium]|nr:sulfite exporter TauE/SafE family protein [Thermoleophilaceae bacterium]
MAVAAIPFGLAIGVAIGTLGGGGSILAVPVLVYVLGEDVHAATTVSLVVVAAAALAGGLGHAREGHVCWRHAAAFTAAALPGVIAGTVAGEALSGDALIVAFAVIMLAGAGATWRRAATAGGDRTMTSTPLCPPLRLTRDVSAGVMIGFLTGLLGVGGGFLIVPTLAIALALSMRLAVGTSLVIIAGTSAMGLAAHLLAGRVLDVDVTATMTVACVAGALAGAAIAARLSQRRLSQGFAALLTTVAAYLVLSTAFWGGPPSS